MERIIKFRGKRVDNGEWIEGALSYMFNNKEMTYIMPNCYFATRDFGEFDENENPIISDSETALGGFVRVIPETVGQFTGLFDKNGKEIYEGDIVRVLYTDWTSKSDSDSRTLEQYLSDISEVGVICFKESRWCVSNVNRFGDIGYGIVNVGKHGFIEIIGNLHDNAELLK